MKKNTLFIVLIMLLLFAADAQSATKEFVITLCEPVANNQSQEQVLQFAQQKASRQALEQAGTFISSETTINNGVLTKDEVTALAAGLVQVEILSSEPDIIEGLIHMRVKSKVTVSMDNLQEQVHALLNNREVMDKLKASQRKVRELEGRLENALQLQLHEKQNSRETIVLKKQVDQLLNEIRLLRDRETQFVGIATKIPKQVKLIAPSQGAASRLRRPKRMD